MTPTADVRSRPGRAAVALLVSCVVLATLVVVADRRIPRDQVTPLVQGLWQTRPRLMGDHGAGGLRVRVGTDQVQVYAGSRLVWASAPNSAFLLSGRGLVHWRADRGYLWPRTERREQRSLQRLENVWTQENSVHLAGTLDDTQPWAVTISADRTGSGATLHAEAPGVDSIALVSGRTPGAAVHGFGEQLAPFDLSGRVIPIVTREQGIGRGEQPLTALADLTNHGAGASDQHTAAAWPTFVTEDVRRVALQSGAVGTDRFALADTRAADRVSLETWAPELTAELTGADTPAELLRRGAGTREPPQTRPMPPGWVTSGAVLGAQGGSAQVRDKLRRVREQGASVSAVWLQDWTGRRTTSFGDRLWWTWQLDRQRYPDWAELVAELHRQGIRTTTYVNPFLVDAEPKDDPNIRNLYAEAAVGGHLVGAAGGGPLLLDQGDFSAAMVDLSRPATRQWFAEVIATQVLAEGVDGFMADFGEGPPPEARPAGGSAAELHNRWPAWWAETVQQGCRLAGREDCSTWFRAGSTSSSQHAAMFWNGDQLVDGQAGDGMASTLLGTFSSGVSGWGLVHSDLGGYTSVDAVVSDHVRGPRTLTRWGELAAFSVLMRTHEGNRPAVNRQVFDPDEAAAFARNTRLFEALAPYRAEVVAESGRTGLPAMRHGWLVAPGTVAARSDTQFFLGDQVLMAPVLRPETAGSPTPRVDVALPPGRWRHLVTGAEVDGDQVLSVDSPPGCPAAYVRAESVWADRLTSAVAEALSR